MRGPIIERVEEIVERLLEATVSATVREHPGRVPRHEKPVAIGSEVECDFVIAGNHWGGGKRRRERGRERESERESEREEDRERERE